MTDDWINSLERDIEICEGQLALADLVSATGIRVDTEVLRRLIQVAKNQPPPIKPDKERG